MKAFALALLVLPAALAAPAASAAGTTVPACACANSAGQTTASGYCQYQGGDLIRIDGKEYCYPIANFARPMDQTFSADYCGNHVVGFNKPVCKTVKVCPLTGDYLKLC